MRKRIRILEKRKCCNCSKELEVLIDHRFKKEVNKRRFCDKKCYDNWQRNIPWEERIGKERADQFRIEASLRLSGDNNPSKNPETAKKISESLKKYIQENDARSGEKNPFYGKNWSDDYKKWFRESRKGKRSYNEEQYQKLLENTPKLENHPNWNNGSSYVPYPIGWDDKLKKEIKKRDEFKCQVCFKETQKLAVHHIDYIKENLEYSNLITLCYSCHGKTNFNRDHWKTFFENLIKEKYDNLS